MNKSIYNKNYRLSDEFLSSIDENDIVNIYIQESKLWEKYQDGNVVFVIYSDISQKHETIFYVEIYQELQILLHRKPELKEKVLDIMFSLEKKLGEFRAGVFPKQAGNDIQQQKPGPKGDKYDYEQIIRIIEKISNSDNNFSRMTKLSERVCNAYKKNEYKNHQDVTPRLFRESIFRHTKVKPTLERWKLNNK